MSELQVISSNPSTTATKNFCNIEFAFNVPAFQKSLAIQKAHFDEIAPEICEKYGLDRKKDAPLITDIDRAQIELAECDGCNGEPCQKRRNQYWLPKIEPNPFGGWRIADARCKIGSLRRLKEFSARCQVPEKYAALSFDDYEETPQNRQSLKIARWFVAKRPLKSLYFFGECGTGKTFLASLIAKEFFLDYKDVVFGDVPQLLAEIKRTFNIPNKDGGAIIDHYGKCDLLVLDDLGAGQVTDWKVGVLYEIINSRYGAGKSMIITSNFDLDGLSKRLASGDPYSSKRIVSRLSEMCVLGFLGTNDRRKQQ